MKKIIYCFWLQIMFFTGCKGQNEQLECLNASLKDNDLKPLYTELRNGFKDTLEAWIALGYERVQVFKTVIWKVDEAVFINPEKNKAILLILKQDTAKYTTDPTGDGSPEKIVPTYLDYIDMVYANKEKDGWHYYYQSMPSIIIPRPENNKGIPVSFDELSVMGRKEVLKGYYRKDKCTYNDHFFDRWDINNLKEKHKKINGYYN